MLNITADLIDRTTNCSNLNVSFTPFPKKTNNNKRVIGNGLDPGERGPSV